MIKKCHSRMWSAAVAFMALFAGLGSSFIWSQEAPAELDQQNSEPEQEAKRKALPSIDELLNSKISALNAKQSEQERVLAQADLALEKELDLEKQTFDNQAYLSISMINTAPPADYKLERTEVFWDGSWRPVAKGGSRNQGLPRNNQQIFFSPIAPGCHEVMVRAKYIRLKNDLISRFKNVERIEVIKKSLPFIATNGYRIELEIEGYEKVNTFVKLYRGPELRFNKSVRPNFLPGAPMVSMDAVLKQGQVRVDYLTQDLGSHRLLNKSLSIDGLPILSSKAHDQEQEKNLVFEAPLAEGKHRLNVTLLFAENKKIGGGPQYNFRVSFDREFYVSSGNTTIVNLIGLPSGGFKSNPRDTRYARATSKILSEEHPEFFPVNSCKELKAIALAAKKNLPPPVPASVEPAVEVPAIDEAKKEELLPEAVPVTEPAAEPTEAPAPEQPPVVEPPPETEVNPDAVKTGE